MEFSSQ
jgi:small-conductance mechanosensitive channel